jgi:hypothetical protein
MKINKKEISQFDKMINACRMDESVSDEFKLFQKKRKKALYKRILIRLGIYSFMSGIGIAVFFEMKKASAIIGSKLLITTLLVAVSASSVIVYKMIEKPVKIAVQLIPDDTSKTTASSAPKAVKAAVDHFTIGLQSFKTGSVDPETLDKVNRYMLASLKSAGNNRYAAFLGEIKEENAAYIANQSIEKLNNTYYIQIKIIDKNTSAIMFASKGTADSESKLQDLCDDLARQVVSAIK